ncbi:MAG: bacteriohemerythrin [Capsulimonadaceae bacterium]|nr:bacteriohemerythrin [Capsulimonadaceae bacterium]
MPLLTWTDELSVGVAVIDSDHRNVVDKLNDLFDGAQTAQSKEKIDKLLNELIALTAAHFVREEQLFAQTEYPDVRTHRAQHAYLCKQALTIQQEFRSGVIESLSPEALDVLKNKLVNHMKGFDKKCGQYLCARDLEA